VTAGRATRRAEYGGMSRWVLAALLAATAVAAPAAEAKPKPKPMSGSYDAFLPVPYALEDASGSHCSGAPEGLSRLSTKLTLPTAGTFAVSLSRIVGDWVIEIYDGNGRLLGYAATLDPTSSTRRTSVKKKSRTRETYTVMVCNYAGGPNGHVDWTFTYA
jgi:hypothetical protein